MIDPKELRIGNWIKTNRDNDMAYFVKSFSTTNAYHGQYIGRSKLLEAFGIRLTPIILQKCGFENTHTEYCETLKNQKLLVEFIPDGNIELRIIQSESESFFLRDIEYLHQLQNLYFALTGEELNYKP